MRTKLKPYDHSLYSPHSWPPSIGEVVILLDTPRGYVGVLEEVKMGIAQVRLLDSHQDRGVVISPLSGLLSTGKLPHDLVERYELSSRNLSENLSTERSFPDFSRLPSKRSTTPKKKKQLTEAQLKFVARLIKAKLKEAGK